MNDFDKSNFFKVMYIFIISIFGTTAKQINNPEVELKNMKDLLRKIFFHGFSGWLFGLAATKYLQLNDLTSITVCAGIGGLFGYDAIIFVTNIALNVLYNSGQIKVKINNENVNNDKEGKII